ncbi:MAG: transglutaminase domain-containing protein [Lachnospiraceae bacterium]|nr:transglutaminase domain-containing protein [Lachnospiraceae bacterium]
MRKWQKRIGCLLIAVIVLQLISCSHEKEQETTTEGMKQSQTEESNENVYGRSESIVLDTGMDFKALQIEYFDDAVELYQDMDLQHKIYCQYDWDKEEKTLTLTPPTYPILNVSTVFASAELLREVEHSDYYLFDKDENQDWGNLGTMYLVCWRDLQTGEQLDAPEITELTIKGELNTPKNFHFEVSEYGNGTLSWEPVEGARKYLIVQAVHMLDEELSGLYESCDIVAETTETTWQAKTVDEYMNQELNMVHFNEPDREYYIGVIAVCEEGTSMVSTLISKKEMASRLPYAKSEIGEEEYSFARFAESIEVTPRYQWIQLCDGTMVQRLIVYDVEKAELVNITDWEDGPKEMISLPYTIEGTDFWGTVYIKEFDKASYQKELKTLEERQNILKSKMQGMLKEVEVTVQSEAASDEDCTNEGNHSEQNDSTSLNDFGDNLLTEPVATNDISRYLAECLLKGQETITIPEEFGTIRKETFEDSFYEAYYQNPLIPSVKEVTFSKSGKTATIIYEEEQTVRVQKQHETIRKVKFVADEIVEDGMSDVDKVLAINAYLCDNVAYDEAVEDSLGDYSDSFTPYGALVNKKGVCLAYAGAFQLLAKSMGVESIVVTGTLNGSEKHAWNKVKIGNDWVVVDVTSNDNDEMENILLNVSDEVAGYMLKEDASYLCKESLENFAAKSKEYEYYHLVGKYYEKEEIADVFIKELSLGSKVVLRTDVTLTNGEFQSIVREVMDGMGQQQLQGYYRLGVISLERKNQ